MEQPELKVGTLYMLRGGHILRYHGLYANKGPCLSFYGPEAPLDGLCAGYSGSADQVLREITSADLDGLENRRQQLIARNLHTDAATTAFVIAEIKAG